MLYKNYEIEKADMLFQKQGYGYSVSYCGDDCLFTTLEKAKEFINEIEQEEGE